jgi:small acid-soluble spore protein F (minor alpha/beta-type SASP)
LLNKSHCSQRLQESDRLKQLFKSQTRDAVFLIIYKKGVDAVARRRPVMSEELKYELAAELGVQDLVRREGWGSVSSRQCGNLVTKAIERAERSLRKES